MQLWAKEGGDVRPGYEPVVGQAHANAYMEGRPAVRAARQPEADARAAARDAASDAWSNRCTGPDGRPTCGAHGGAMGIARSRSRSPPPADRQARGKVIMRYTTRGRVVEVRVGERGYSFEAHDVPIEE